MTRHQGAIRAAVTSDEIRPELARIGRRNTLLRGLSVGSLGLLTGCDLSTHSGVDAALWAMLRFNDKVQAALFSRTRLAPTFPLSAVTQPFRFNAFYEEWQVREVPDGWSLEVAGLVSDRSPWTLDRLRALPQQAQVTRHICIEGWSQIGQWSGPTLSDVLRGAGADMTAKYVGFSCFDGYSTSLDMESALHPQTILALDSWASLWLLNGARPFGYVSRSSSASRAPRACSSSPSATPIQVVFGRSKATTGSRACRRCAATRWYHSAQLGRRSHLV